MALDVDGLAHRVPDVPPQPAGVPTVQRRAEAEEDEEDLGNGRELLGIGWRVQLVRKPTRERHVDRHRAFAVAVLVLPLQPLLFSLDQFGRFALGRRPRKKWKLQIDFY